MIGFRGPFTLIWLVLGFALGMANLLNFFKFEHTVRSLQYDRIQIVARDVDDAIQSNLAYSASLEGSGTLSQLISQTLLADPLILSADIFGQNGKVLYTSDAGRISQQLPPTWQEVANRSHRADWLVQDAGAFVAGRTVTNSFGVQVATVAVRYQRHDYDNVTAHVLGGMTRLGLITYGTILVVGAVFLACLMKLQGIAQA